MRHEKGQLSADVLLAIIAAGVFFTVMLNAFSPALSSDMETQRMRNDAAAILLDFYSVAGDVNADSNLTASYASPLPAAYDLNTSCKITKNSVANGSMGVSLKKGGKDTSKNYAGISLTNLRVLDAAGNSVNDFNCGETVTITRVKQ